MAALASKCQTSKTPPRRAADCVQTATRQTAAVQTKRETGPLRWGPWMGRALRWEKGVYLKKDLIQIQQQVLRDVWEGRSRKSSLMRLVRILLHLAKYHNLGGETKGYIETHQK